MGRYFMKSIRLVLMFLVILSVSISVIVVSATCVPADVGTSGDDTIDCTTTNPPATAVTGFAGNDTISIGAGVTVNGGVSGGDFSSNPESGSDTIYNAGTVNGDVVGDSGFGNGSGNDVIVNDGSVTGSIDGDTSFGTGSGNDMIVNNGTVDSIFADSANGNSSGSDTVTNNGTVNSSIYGDGSGGSADGSDTIVNNGTVAVNIYGDGNGVGTGSDNITNNGSVTNIIAAGGNDTITNNGVVNGDIRADDGDDTVIIAAGTAVVGDGIDGGNGYDVLTFNINSTDPAELEAVAALIASQSPSGGTITINGITYVWLNFEELTRILSIVRLNGPADPLAVFCAVSGGIDVYAISNNQGFFSLYLSLQQISSGVTHAQEIGDEVLIASSSTASVYALVSGELRVRAPNGFTFTLVASRCGALPEPQPFTVIREEEIEDSFVIINRPR